MTPKRVEDLFLAEDLRGIGWTDVAVAIEAAETGEEVDTILRGCKPRIEAMDELHAQIRSELGVDI